MWQKENQDINGFFKITPNASLVKVLAATLDGGLEITGNKYTHVGWLTQLTLLLTNHRIAIGLKFKSCDVIG